VPVPPAKPLTDLSNKIAARLVRPKVYAQHQWLFFLFALVLAALLPLVVTSGYGYNVAINASLFVILSLGFYFQFALGGQFSFATPAYYATGAYVYAWAAPSHGFILAFLLAVVVTAIVGGITKLLLVRSPLIHFAIATLAFGQLMLIVYENWTSFTGGDPGKFGIPQPDIFGLKINTNTKEYYLVAAVAVIGTALLIAFERSPAQRDLVFVRDMGPVAKTSGLRTAYLQISAFAAGAGYMGAVGALRASSAGFVDIASFQTQNNVSIALLVLLMVLLGGIGIVWGPIIGAIVLTVLPQILNSWQNYEELVYAIAILVIILILPGGLTSLPAEFRMRRAKLKLRVGGSV
jgi:branched-chain amino acid transport system permease protein